MRVEQYNQRVGNDPLPSARQQAQRPATSIGEGLSELGGSVRRSAERLGQVAISIHQEQQRKADETALLGADNALDQLERNLLDAPDVGALVTVRGKDALGIREKVLPSYDEQAGMIASSLANTRQQDAFAIARARRRQGIVNKLDAHVNRELQVYRVGEAKAGLESALNMAALNAADPKRVDEQLAKIDTIFDTHGADLGIVGPEALEAAKQEWRSKALESVIAQAIGPLENPELAKVYSEEGKHLLSADAQQRIFDKVKAGTRDKRALDASEAIWKALAPPGDNDVAPISIDKMEEAARVQFKNDPEIFKLTVTYLRSKLNGVETGRKARLDTRDDAVWRAVAGGASLTQLRSMEQYRAMSGKEQGQITDYLRNKAYQEESRASARASRADAEESRALRKQERDGYAAYFTTVTDAKFADAAPADILRRLPELGPTHVGRLLNELEQQKNARSQLRTPHLDADVFKSAVSDAGYPYVNSTAAQLTENQKANLGRLRATVEDEVTKAQVASGNKQLSVEEQRAIVTGVLSSKVTLRDQGKLWYDVDVPSVFVDQAGRANAYIPLDRIPATAASEALNYLRGLPGNSRKTDAELRSTYRPRLERAYGVSQSGGTRQEVLDILEGKVR